MTPERIRTSRESLDGKIKVIKQKLAGLESKLAGLKEICKHPDLKENYVMGDYYSKGYTSKKCPDCGLRDD